MSPRRVWIDTDPGFDDLATLVLAHRHAELAIEGVGVVAGNAPLPDVLDNALRIADALGLAAPVFAGCDRPLVRPRHTAEAVLGAGALGSTGATLPAARRTAAPGHAAIELVEAARRLQGELTLVAIGPLTNVAVALRLEPRLPELLREIVIMGGSSDRGNETAAAEFNFFADPDAASAVLSSGARIALFGLNLTRQVLLTREHVERVRAATPLAPAWADMMAHYLRIRDRSGLGSMPLHDPVTVAYLLEPDAFELRPARVDVETCGTVSLGASVCEFRVPARAAANVAFAVAADGERVMRLVVEAFAGLG